MTDRRRLAANDRVAASHLRGQIDAPRFVDGSAAQVHVPVTDLLRAPGGARDRQLLLGAPLTVYETYEGWSFVQAEDDYVGYVSADSLGAAIQQPTHTVATAATHAYTAPDLKSHERAALPHGARLAVEGINDTWAATPMGHVPVSHLVPLAHRASDPVEVALLYLGTPYLWGGNSIWGIDCSGLVQAACRACGISCPGDSDMQEAELGERLPDGAPLQRGDIVFWRGHVGIMEDDRTLLHANAHAMAVAREDFAGACQRIADQGDGPVTSRRRITRPSG
ncbi:MAG: NLP/P60 hydrolase [Rhodobacterales bacterium]|nr:MAG: NLP/P60 hydrolase [Rhodobacterales bacterium]